MKRKERRKKKQKVFNSFCMDQQNSRGILNIFVYKSFVTLCCKLYLVRGSHFEPTTSLYNYIRSAVLLLDYHAPYLSITSLHVLLDYYPVRAKISCPYSLVDKCRFFSIKCGPQHIPWLSIRYVSIHAKVAIVEHYVIQVFLICNN